jgi:hypothetical protein
MCKLNQYKGENMTIENLRTQIDKIENPKNINELLLLENYHIAGNACRMFVSGEKNNIEYSVFGNGDTEIELTYPLYVGNDESEAISVFLEAEKLKMSDIKNKISKIKINGLIKGDFHE